MFEKFKAAAQALGCTVRGEQLDTGYFMVTTVCPNGRVHEAYVSPDKAAFSFEFLKQIIEKILEGGMT